MLGTDGIGADMLEEFRLGYARLREDDVTATPDVAWQWLENAYALVPEARLDRVTWGYESADPWRLAFTPGVRAIDVVDRRRDRARRRSTDARRRRRDPRPRRRTGRPAVLEALGGMMAPVAMYLQDAHSIREGMELVQYAEARGFSAVWQAESRLVREATVPMASFLAVTERITVGSGVVNNWTRNPALLASTFATLDDLAPGRVILGIGAWWDPLAQKVGIERRKPLTAMRETVTVVRALLNDETVTFDGEFVHLDGVELDYVHQERRPKAVPIYIGATGMQMMELTGEIADGVVLNYLVSPAYNDTAMAHLATGASTRGPRGRRHRPAAARRVLARRRSRSCSRQRAPARDAVPRTAAAHHEGIGRARGAPGRDRRRAHVACDPRSGRRRVEARPGRDRADDHRVGDGRRVPQQGRRVLRAWLHVPDPLPAR